MHDRWFLALTTVLVLFLWFQGYEAADGGEPTRADAAPAPILGRQGAEGGTASTALPAGLRVDPSTGLLLGVVPPDIPGVAPLMWELLRTYSYRPGLEGLPDPIRDLDGKKVVMVGFLMTVFEYDDIHEFHLVASHWSCCYGVPPGLDGAVRVKLAKGQDGLPNTIKPLRVIGTLRVKEVIESEIVYAIYTIEDAEAAIMDY